MIYLYAWLTMTFTPPLVSSWSMNQQDKLTKGLLHLEEYLADRQLLQEKAEAYLRLLQSWNRTHNLTSIRDPEKMVVLHVLDSLSVLPWIEHTRIADLGAGGGLPGIPLALARPDLSVTLIESNGKKCSFLRHCKRELDLQNIEVWQQRGEAGLSVDEDELFAAIVSRAFATLSDFAEIAAPLLADDGCLFAMKGKSPDQEIAAIEQDFAVEVQPLQVPGLDAERHLVMMKRR